MSNIIKAAMTAAFLMTSVVGVAVTSPAFAAQNNGGKSKDNKCANDASGANAGANCTTEPNDTQK